MAVALNAKKYYAVVLTDGSEQVSEYTTLSKAGAIEVANYIDEKRRQELKASNKSIEVWQVTVENKTTIQNEVVYFIKYSA